MIVGEIRMPVTSTAPKLVYSVFVIIAPGWCCRRWRGSRRRGVHRLPAYSVDPLPRRGDLDARPPPRTGSPRGGEPWTARARPWPAPGSDATSAASSKPAGPTARVKVVGFESWASCDRKTEAETG